VCALTSKLVAAAAAGIAQDRSLESHEGLTSRALPWTDPAQYKDKFPKKSPYAGGVLAVQVAFPERLRRECADNLERIRLTVQLDSDNRQEVPSLNSEELADAVLKPKAKDPTASRPKLPLPVGGSKGGARQTLGRVADAGAKTRACPPASWRRTARWQGLLYFDLQDQFDLLQNAQSLRASALADDERPGAMTFFDIDLSRRSNAIASPRNIFGSEAEDVIIDVFPSRFCVRLRAPSPSANMTEQEFSIPTDPC